MSLIPYTSFLSKKESYKQNKLHWLWKAFLVFPLLFAGCKSHDEVKVPQDWIAFDTADYKTIIPNDWEVKQDDVNTEFLVLSPTTSANDRFRENVNLVKESLQGKKISLDKYIELTLKNLDGLLQDASEIKKEENVKNSTKYVSLIYSGKRSGYDLKFEQLIWLERGNAFVLTYTAEAHEFDTFKDQADKIMQNFSLN